MFKTIQIQTIHKCNLKCDFCPNSTIEQTGNLMDLNLFQEIILQLEILNYKGRVALYLMNEPLLDNRINWMIRYTKKHLPDSEIMLSTNGVLLTKKMVEVFKLSGMNRIMVSCYNESIYNKVKDWDVQTIKFYEKDLQKQFYNRGGNSNGYGGEVEQKYCKNPFQQMYITYEGYAVICCADYKREVIMGDVNKQLLKDIWFGNKYEEYRQELRKGNRKNLKLCRTCNY